MLNKTLLLKDHIDGLETIKGLGDCVNCNHFVLNDHIDVIYYLDPKHKKFGTVSFDYDEAVCSLEDAKKIIDGLLAKIMSVLKDAYEDFTTKSAEYLANVYGSTLTPYPEFDYASSLKYYSLKRGTFSWYLD